MPELNHSIIQNAIKVLLESDSTLYDAASTNGAKLITIQQGIPLGDNYTTELLPGAFITLESERFENIGAVESQVTSAIEHHIKYKIRVIVADNSSKKNEQLLNEFQKKILDIIENNNDLSNSVDSCFPESITRVREDAKNSILVRDIIVRCVATTN